MKRPSFQFYPADWRKDAALQGCPIAARGLWHEMMCLMHECEPYGYLSVNGKPMKPETVARLVGISSKEYTKLVAELQEAGVLSITEDGCIYSRRMVKDEQVRMARANGGSSGAEHGQKGAEHGARGGRPTKERGDKKPPLEPPLGEDLKPPLKPPPSSSSSSSSSIKEKDKRYSDTPPIVGVSAAFAASPPVDNSGFSPSPHPEPAKLAPAPPQPVDLIFAMGLPLLTSAGVAEKQARSMLGMLRKQHDDTEIVRAIQQCADDQAIEPVAYLQRVLRNRNNTGPPRGMNRQEALEAMNLEVAKRLAGTIE